MKIKNLNPIELHIEKAILGVAVLAAGYLAYVCATSPTMVQPPGQPAIEPKDVEMQVRKAIDALETKREFTDRQIEPERKLRIVDVTYAEQYQRALAYPLPEQIVNRPAQVVIGPPQILAIKPETTQQTTTGLVNAVTLPPLDQPLKAEVFIGTVGAAVNKTVLEKRDARVVRASTQFAMGKLRDSIDAAQLPPNFEAVVVQRVEWQRQEKLPDGKWSSWEAVKPLAGAPVPATNPAKHVFTAAEAMKDITEAKLGTKGGEAAYWLKWLMGNMSTEMQPDLPAKQFDREGGAPLFPPVGAAPAIPAGTAAPAAAAPAVVRPGAAPVATAPAEKPPRAPAIEAYGGLIGEPEKKGAGPVALVVDPLSGDPGSINTAGLADWANLTSKTETPIWVYDDHVEAGHEYRYRARVTIYNPLFQWPAAALAKVAPAARSLVSVPNIVGEWSPESNPVKMDLTDFFFATSLGAGVTGGSTQVIKFEIYRYVLGKWEKAVHSSAGIGTEIGISSSQSPVVGSDANRADLTEKYSMGYTVVDIMPTGPNDGTIVLMDPMGQLITRTVSIDAASEQHKALDAKVAKKVPGTAGTAPAGPGPG